MDIFSLTCGIICSVPAERYSRQTIMYNGQGLQKNKIRNQTRTFLSNPLRILKHLLEWMLRLQLFLLVLIKFLERDFFFFAWAGLKTKFLFQGQGPFCISEQPWSEMVAISWVCPKFCWASGIFRKPSWSICLHCSYSRMMELQGFLPSPPRISPLLLDVKASWIDKGTRRIKKMAGG